MANAYPTMDIPEASCSQTESANRELVNWDLCALCQKNTGEKLVNPFNKTQKDCRHGYQALAHNLKEFHEIGRVPLDINIQCLNDGTGIENTLLANKAVWHKNCWLMCSNMKLQRAKKRKQVEEHETTSPVKTRSNLRCSSAAVPEKEEICFFCEKASSQEPLHSASTKNIDVTVRECATELRDTKLLAKLAAGDMVAVDAVYHLSCLTDLRNRFKCHQQKKLKDDPYASLEAIVFGELVAYIEEAHQNESIIPVFKLSELVKLYSERLKELDDASEKRVHSTRLKERLLKQFPELRAQQQGRDVVLMFDQDIGDMLKRAVKNDMDADAVHLVRAAQIVRREIFQSQYEFQGSFEDASNIVPPSLKALMSMILEGPNIEEQKQSNQSKQRAAIGLSQIAMFNAVKKSSARYTVRHNKKRETPLPVYLSLLVHAQTRKRDLVDRLYNMGLCISYDRMMSISTQMANRVCALYERDHVVCPPSLKNDVFTSGAVDNIDHNPTARTAQDSFHGTAITLMQFPTTECPGNNRDIPSWTTDAEDGKQKKIAPLPASYTQVPPSTAANVVTAPTSLTNIKAESSLLGGSNQEEQEWLQKVATLLKKEKLDKDDFVSWAAHHASNQPPLERQVTTIALLPLFTESAHTVSMILHAMNVVKLATDHVHQGQTPVITMDQPLFALAKAIQWTWPALHGEDKIVVMLGGLHTEMNLLRMLGDWMDGSGWTSALVLADIATQGRADGIIKASHVTRTRYAHQVTAASLHILLQSAYKRHTDDSSPGEELSYEEWLAQNCLSHPMFKYWTLTLELELTVLQFVKSLRTANFELYKQTMGKLVPWLFALDHTNYARWLPVHIRDMVGLEHKHPDVYREFMNGHFVVQKAKHTFSAISVDQAHEQVNEHIKGDGGAVGLTENPQALHRWMVAGPEIARAVGEFQQNFTDTDLESQSHKHHEQTPAVQNAFARHVESLVSTIEDMGNPFLEDSGDLLVLDTKAIMNDAVVQTVQTIEDSGLQQYDTFVRERFQQDPACPLSDTVKKNNFPLFKNPVSKAQSRQKYQVSSLKSSCDLFARLYISCQARQGNIDEFFQHENQAAPPSLSDMGQLRQGNKADLLKCFEQITTEPQGSPEVQAKVFDGAAVVHLLPPKGCRTFKDYAENVFVPYIWNQLHCASRVDIVWDRYIPDSLKQQSREHRAHSKPLVRQRVQSHSPIPGNWLSFLRVNENKSELFEYLSGCVEQTEFGDKVVVSTRDQDAVSSSEVNLEYLQPCTHEEADSRLILHAANCASSGYNQVCIRTVDTDVVVLAVAYVETMNLTELWLAFGTGKHFRYIPAHEISKSIGPLQSRTLPIFHAFTGCDTVSYFLGRGKRSAWEAWQACPEISGAFLQLMCRPADVSDDILKAAERFVIVMYCRTCPLEQIDEARKQLFSHGSRTMDNIPPTRAALLQHTKRAAYQAGHVWSQCLDLVPNLPSPSDWGWIKDGTQWKPHWTDLQDASRHCYELIHCGCKKGCRQRCKCRSSNLPCTELCICRGACTQT